MKKTDPKKINNDLENQKVDSSKIQGGGARPQPPQLSKDYVPTLQAPEQGKGSATGFASNANGDGSLISRRGIKSTK